MHEHYDSGHLIGGAERRYDADRRQTTLTSVVWHSRGGRRRHARRGIEQCDYYIDWYEPQLLWLTMAIMLLSCTDAVLTLTLLARGATELNGFMALLIETDVRLFATVKVAVTGVCLVVLVAHVRFRLFRRIEVSRLLPQVLGLYAVLIAYELVLLSG